MQRDTSAFLRSTPVYRLSRAVKVSGPHVRNMPQAEGAVAIGHAQPLNIGEVVYHAGAFLSFDDLGEEALAQLMSWGAAQGWLTSGWRWRATWLDEELQAKALALFPDEEAARRFADRIGGDFALAQVLVPTPACRARAGSELSDLFALDVVALFWVEDETELDGVWWHNLADPERYGLPWRAADTSDLDAGAQARLRSRGVICSRRVERWGCAPEG